MIAHIWTSECLLSVPLGLYLGVELQWTPISLLIFPPDCAYVEGRGMTDIKSERLAQWMAEEHTGWVPGIQNRRLSHPQPRAHLSASPVVQTLCWWLCSLYLINSAPRFTLIFVQMSTVISSCFSDWSNHPQHCLFFFYNRALLFFLQSSCYHWHIKDNIFHATYYR